MPAESYPSKIGVKKIGPNLEVKQNLQRKEVDAGLSDLTQFSCKGAVELLTKSSLTCFVSFISISTIR